MRGRRLFLVLALILVLSYTALAQLGEPTFVVNDRHQFAYTVQSNTIVEYEHGGDGFKCIHNASGGGEGTEPDYGLLVYGKEYYGLNAKEAEAAGYDPPEIQVLTVEDVGDTAALNEIIRKAMQDYDLEPVGDASVRLPDGRVMKVPYYKWSQTMRGVTRYALEYAVVHNDSFVRVQVESSYLLSSDQEEWLIGKLELLQDASSAAKPSAAGGEGSP